MRVVVVATGILLSLAVPAQAAYEDVEFTQLLDDSGDHPLAYHDFATLSVGEPGDGTVVFRGTVRDIDQLPRDDATIMYFGFTTDAFILGGAFYDLQLVTRNIGQAVAPDACQKQVSANAIYCTWAYERIRAEPGMTITNIWAFIDGCATRTGCLPMDNGPGSVANQGWNPSSTPHTYTLTGCTLIGGCAPDEPAPQTIRADLATPSLEHAFANATSDTYILNFTTELANSTAAFAWNATAGAVDATLRDANGTVRFNGTLEGNGTLLHGVADAAPGTWNLTLGYRSFNGTFSFSLQAPADPDPATGEGDGAPTGNGTADGDGNGTAEPVGSGGNDTPIPLLVPVLALLLVAARRRR